MSTSAIYGSDALRLMRARQGASTAAPECQPSLLEQIPPDAPMDDATRPSETGRGSWRTIRGWRPPLSVRRAPP